VVLRRRHRCDLARLGEVRRVDVAQAEVSDESLVAKLSEGLEPRRDGRAVWRFHCSHAQVHQVQAVQTERRQVLLDHWPLGSWIVGLLSFPSAVDHRPTFVAITRSSGYGDRASRIRPLAVTEWS
jgi:hypothetical protein